VTNFSFIQYRANKQIIYRWNTVNLARNNFNRKMKANDSLNSVVERFDTFTSVIYNCNNQNAARCKVNNNLRQPLPFNVLE